MALLASYRRHLWLFLAVSISVMVAVVALVLIQPKAYTATSGVMLIASDRVEMPGAEATKQNSDTATAAYITTEVEALKSRDLAGQVVDDLKLVADPEFNKHVGVAPVDPSRTREMVITSVLKNLKVRRTGETYVATIDFSSQSPVKAAKIANAFATGFIASQEKAKVQAAATANALIATQLEPLRQEVEAAESAVAQYKGEHGLLSVAGSTLNEQELGNLTQQVMAARANQAEAEARLSTAQAQIRKGSDGDDVGEALNSTVVLELRKQRAVLSGRVADLQSRYGPKHPDLVNARNQLADVDAQIQSEIGRLMSNLKAQVEIARGRTAAVTAGLDQVRGNLVTSSDASVQLNELQRRADAARATYEASLNKARLTSQQLTMSQPDAEVSSFAKPPLSPSAPNKLLGIALGLVIGGGAGAATVVARRALDSTLRTQDDVERKLGAPFLASIPTVISAIDKPLSKDPAEAVLKHPLSAFAEAFRALTTAVTLGQGREVKVIAITSSLPAEGKTTTSICVSEILAIGGSRVVTVDCDLRRRSVDATLGAGATTGLLDVLNGSKSLDEGLFVDRKSGVSYLLLPRNAVAGAVSPLDSPAFDALLAKLRERFDYVILDTPPLLPVVDTRKIAPKVDAVVVLCRWQSTPKRAVQHGLRLLSDAGVAPTGVALTMVNLKAQQRYGYGDASYYQKSYSDYYLEGGA